MIRRLIQFVLIFIIVADIAGIGFLVYLTLGSKGAADSANEELVDFTVMSGQGAREIAANLEKESIIANDLFFSYYAWRQKAANLLQAGEYELSPSMPIPTIIKIMVEGEVKFDPGIKVTIPEGYRTSQIEETIIASGLPVKKSELQEAVGISASLAHEIFGFAFLNDLPADATIDGFLFPDTYFFDESVQLNDIIRKMLQNFEAKVPDALRVKIKAQGKDFYEVIILASLVEKEVRTSKDMRLVSGVLWKRMEIGMPLQVDATLAYITGKKTGEITNDDKLIDSPYNTYLYRGLPPSPITNPGLNAIKAAIDHQESDYLYYLSKPSGETVFSKTLDEHNENKARYLR